MNADELSNAEAALLGLLSDRPMYPYQIEQEVEYRDMRFWTDLSMSSIYKLLVGLERKGLVTRTNEVTPNNRLRKLYALSERGTQALLTKLAALLRVPEHVRWQIDIGTYNSGLLPPGEVAAALREYRQALEKKIGEYEELEGFMRGSGCPSQRLAVAIRPVFLLRGELQWVDSFLSTFTESQSGQPDHSV